MSFPGERVILGDHYSVDETYVKHWTREGHKHLNRRSALIILAGALVFGVLVCAHIRQPWGVLFCILLGAGAAVSLVQAHDHGRRARDARDRVGSHYVDVRTRNKGVVRSYQDMEAGLLPGDSIFRS